MPAGFITVRVYWVHDENAWYAALNRPDAPVHPLAATDLASAEAEVAALLQTRFGMHVVSGWTYSGDDEAGAQAVAAESGSGDATKAHLVDFWTAHKTLLGKLGVNVATLPAATKATLFSQDVMLVGLAKALVDRGVLTPDDLTAACSAVGAADFSWLTGL